MNRQIRQLAGALIVLYVVLFAALNYWQVGRTEELASQRSNRALIRQFDSPRGPIVTADGVVIARSEQVPGATDVKFRRLYPTGELFANVTGYYVRSGFDAVGEDPVRRAQRRHVHTAGAPSTRCSAARTTSPARST